MKLKQVLKIGQIKDTVLHIDKFKDATRTERNGSWEIIPTGIPEPSDVLAKHRGYAIAKYFPELLEQVDEKIKLSAKDCQNSWSKT